MLITFANSHVDINVGDYIVADHNSTGDRSKGIVVDIQFKEYKPEHQYHIIFLENRGVIDEISSYLRKLIKIMPST